MAPKLRTFGAFWWGSKWAAATYQGEVPQAVLSFSSSLNCPPLHRAPQYTGSACGVTEHLVLLAGISLRRRGVAITVDIAEACPMPAMVEVVAVVGGGGGGRRPRRRPLHSFCLVFPSLPAFVATVVTIDGCHACARCGREQQAGRGQMEALFNGSRVACSTSSGSSTGRGEPQ